MLRLAIIMPRALKASVMMEPCGGWIMYDLRRMTRMKMPTLNMRKHMRKAVQKPQYFSMKGVAMRDREPRLMHQ